MTTAALCRVLFVTITALCRGDFLLIGVLSLPHYCILTARMSQVSGKPCWDQREDIHMSLDPYKTRLKEAADLVTGSVAQRMSGRSVKLLVNDDAADEL